jgi:hypothetical protein
MLTVHSGEHQTPPCQRGPSLGQAPWATSQAQVTKAIGTLRRQQRRTKSGSAAPRPCTTGMEPGPYGEVTPPSHKPSPVKTPSGPEYPIAKVEPTCEP